MMDRPDPDLALLEDDLRNIQRLNTWFGAHRLIRAEFDIFLDRWTATPENTKRDLAILDLCTGSGDLPRVVADSCRHRGLRFRITATDLNPRMLDQARRESAAYPEISFEKADLLAPPFADGSHDWVMCNLALHHFSAEQAVTALRHLWRLARAGLLVNDLHRNRMITLLMRHGLPLVCANPMTRFDAHLSTLRAFTADELLRLAFHAGIPSPEIRLYPFGRQTLTAWHPPRS